MQVPKNKTITFTFMSPPNKNSRLKWAVMLTFHAGSEAGAMLSIKAVDGNEELIKSAEFHLAGKCIEIKDGKGELSYSDFIQGRHETALWLCLPTGESIPGGLTFA